jgi:hypothetical protein
MCSIKEDTMHWLFLLAILSSTTSVTNGGTPSTMNRLAENALRKQLGNTGNVRVQMAPGTSKARGDFDYFNITLDGFAADRLLGLAERAQSSGTSSRDNGSRYPGDEYSRDDYPLQGRTTGTRNLDIGDLGDILNNRGGLGDILGGVLGGKGAGRIGRIRLRATNFTFQGARYDSLDATLGEVRFDWAKALRGDFDIKSVQPGTLGLSLRADQAARLLGPRLPSIRDLRVRFSNGLAYFGGRTEYLGVGVPFEVGGRLSVAQNEVRADNIQASVAKFRLPSFVVSELTRGVNPLYDFDPQDRWPLAINLQTAGTTNNAMALRGGLQWRGFNSRSRAPQGRNRQERNRQDYDPGYDTDGDNTSTRDSYPDDYSDESGRTSGSRRPQDILGDIFGR